MLCLFGTTETTIPIAPPLISPKRPFSSMKSPILNRGISEPPSFVPDNKKLPVTTKVIINQCITTLHEIYLSQESLKKLLITLSDEQWAACIQQHFATSSKMYK